METPEIIASNKGGFTPVKPGTYSARCYSMIVIGTIDGEYKGKPVTSTKVQIAWELPTERKEFREGEGEKPYTIFKEYTLSLGEKSSLRKDLVSWRGQEFTSEEATRFNVAKLVGVTCTLSIINETKGDKTYAKVTAIGPKMKDVADYKQVNPSFILTYQNWDWDAFKSLPEWLQKKMQTSREYQSLTSALMDEDKKRIELESELQSNGPGAIEDLPF